jgi:hypothetical protein
MNRFSDIPTPALKEMWSAERERLSHVEGLTPSDCEDLLAMRTELDRRAGERKPVVNADFAGDYLTD